LNNGVLIISWLHRWPNRFCRIALCVSASWGSGRPPRFN